MDCGATTRRPRRKPKRRRRAVSAALCRRTPWTPGAVRSPDVRSRRIHRMTESANHRRGLARYGLRWHGPEPRRGDTTPLPGSIHVHSRLGSGGRRCTEPGNRRSPDQRLPEPTTTSARDPAPESQRAVSDTSVIHWFGDWRFGGLSHCRGHRPRPGKQAVGRRALRSRAHIVNEGGHNGR